MKQIITLMLIVLPLSAAAGNDTREFLITLDALLTPPGDVVTEISITTFKDSNPISEHTYTCFSDSETDQFLLICKSPPSRQGFAYIKRKDRIWAYSPVVRAFFSVEEYDFIEGTAVRIEDFLPAEYDTHYEVQSKRKSGVNREPALKLQLMAVSATAPYDNIIVWIHEEKMLLLKEELYDSGSHLLKTIRYSGLREKDGWYQPSKILITDAMNDNITSLISVTKTTISPVPEYVFTRSFVEFITR